MKYDPTSKPKEKGRKYFRTCPDPFLSVTAQMREWFDVEPWRTSRELLERLQREQPDIYPDKLLRTLQRRVKVWRRENAHQLVFGGQCSGLSRCTVPASIRYVTLNSYSHMVVNDRRSPRLTAKPVGMG